MTKTNNNYFFVKRAIKNKAGEILLLQMKKINPYDFITVGDMKFVLHKIDEAINPFRITDPTTGHFLSVGDSKHQVESNFQSLLQEKTIEVIQEKINYIQSTIQNTKKIYEN